MPSGDGALPSRETLTAAWGDAVLKTLRPRVRGLFGSGRFVSVEEGVAIYGFEGAPLRDMAEDVRPEVEVALAAHFGRTVPLRLVVAATGVAPAGGGGSSDEEEPPDLTTLSDAPPDARGPMDHLSAAFPGAEVVDEGRPSRP